MEIPEESLTFPKYPEPMEIDVPTAEELEIYKEVSEKLRSFREPPKVEFNKCFFFFQEEKQEKSIFEQLFDYPSTKQKDPVSKPFDYFVYPPLEEKTSNFGTNKEEQNPFSFGGFGSSSYEKKEPSQFGNNETKKITRFVGTNEEKVSDFSFGGFNYPSLEEKKVPDFGSNKEVNTTFLGFGSSSYEKKEPFQFGSNNETKKITSFVDTNEKNEVPTFPFQKPKNTRKFVKRSRDLDRRFDKVYKLPIIRNRFKYVGRMGVYKGRIHHWVEREDKRSSYRRNPVNY